MTLALRYAAHTDAASVPRPERGLRIRRPHLLALADGMGGRWPATCASAITIDESATSTRPGTRTRAATPGEQLSSEQRANRGPDRSPTRTSRAWAPRSPAACSTDDVAIFAHVGDSRAYLLRGNRLEMITKDHSFVQMLVDQGQITRRRPTHPPAPGLDHACPRRPAGPRDRRVPVDIRAGDRLLLCSDGLDDAAAKDDMIADVLAGARDPDEPAPRDRARPRHRAAGQHHRPGRASSWPTGRGRRLLTATRCRRPWVRRAARPRQPPTNSPSPVSTTPPRAAVAMAAPAARPTPEGERIAEPDIAERARYAPRPPADCGGCAALRSSSRCSPWWWRAPAALQLEPVAVLRRAVAGRRRLAERGSSRGSPAGPGRQHIVRRHRRSRLNELPTYQREQAAKNIPAKNFARRRSIASQLRDSAALRTHTDAHADTHPEADAVRHQEGRHRRTGRLTARPRRALAATRSPSATRQPATPKVEPDAPAAVPPPRQATK